MQLEFRKCLNNLSVISLLYLSCTLSLNGAAKEDSDPSDFSGEVYSEIISSLSSEEQQLVLGFFSIDRHSTVEGYGLWYCDKGGCKKKSPRWYLKLLDIFKHRKFKIQVVFNRDFSGCDSSYYQTPLGLQKVIHYHEYNIVDEIIIDSTYLQFLDLPGDFNISPLFIGTQEDLIILMQKYRRFIRPNSASRTLQLEAREVERFVTNNWPVRRTKNVECEINNMVNILEIILDPRRFKSS